MCVCLYFVRCLLHSTFTKSSFYKKGIVDVSSLLVFFYIFGFDPQRSSIFIIIAFDLFIIVRHVELEHNNNCNP